MIVSWVVEDGFIGNGIHRTWVDDDALIDLTPEEKTEEIEAWVEDDFEERVAFCITHIEPQKNMNEEKS